MKDQKTILLIGLGGLGQAILEFLVRVEGIGKIVVGSRNEKRGEARCNLVRMGATAQGFQPEVEFVPINLIRVDATTDRIYQISPEIILNTASMMTWWYPNLFPVGQRHKLLQAGFGVWLPVHLHLAMKLMQTLKLLNYKGYVLNASFPDVVNPILKARGLTPTTGIGNLDEIVPKVKLLGSDRLKVRPDELKVTMVGHHALGGWVFGGREGKPPPYYMRVEHKNRDVTEEINASELLLSSFPLPHGPVWDQMSASSAVRMVSALISETKIHLHAPGLRGLPGGYPVTASRDGIELALPEELPLEAAIDINQASHPFDGVQQIEPDGSVIFCQESVEIMRENLGYECERLLPWETESLAEELIYRFRVFASKCGVELPSVIEID
jgi:hypothetical protein